MSIKNVPSPVASIMNRNNVTADKTQSVGALKRNGLVVHVEHKKAGANIKRLATPEKIAVAISDSRHTFRRLLARCNSLASPIFLDIQPLNGSVAIGILSQTTTAVQLGIWGVLREFQEDGGGKRL